MQQQRRCEPFVGVVAGIIEHGARPLSEFQQRDGAAAQGEGERPAAERRVTRRQAADAQRQQLRRERNVRRDDREAERNDQALPDAQTLRVEQRVCDLQRAQTRAEPACQRPKRVAAPDAAAYIAQQKRQEPLLGLRVSLPGLRQPLRPLKIREILRSGAPKRQLDQSLLHSTHPFGASYSEGVRFMPVCGKFCKNRAYSRSASFRSRVRYS